MSDASTYEVSTGTIDELIFRLQEIRKQYGNVKIYRLDTDWGTSEVESVSYDHAMRNVYDAASGRTGETKGGWVIT